MVKARKFWALDDVSFDLYRGETLGIVGRNGAGKSTLMRLIAGIYDADRGQLERENYTASLLQLQVGFSPHLTGRQNAVMSGILLGMRKDDIVSRLKQVEEFSGLGEFMDEPVRSYSTGMKARLGFAVAWQADPDVLLVDEVLGVGDFEFKSKSSQMLRERIRSGKTAVIVAHQPKIVEELCDRVVWIEKGKTIMSGEPNIVLSEYESLKKSNRSDLKV